MDEKILDVRKRALSSIDPDEIANIMDEVSPWAYPQQVLYELMMHLRAALYRNLVNMFMGIELNFDRASIDKVDEVTGALASCLDEKNNILPELPENIKNMLTWLASLENKMDFYEPKLSGRVINRYMDYAGGYITEVYIREYGFAWAECSDGDVKYVIKKGDMEIGEPSVSVYKQLIGREEHMISATFNKFRSRIEN